MNLSHYLKRLLFESFPTDFGSASWSTNPSMSYEAEPKSVKKSFKNQLFSNSERGS